MSHDHALSAFLRLRSFAADTSASPLDRLVTGNAAAWLAHATCYGVTADSRLLADIADPEKHPVARAKTLSHSLVRAVTVAGLPASPPFQSVDVLYSAFEDDDGAVEWHVQNPLEAAMQRGPQF
ncbi:hypothetical protein [Sulfitobacter sp. DSM 110093]|uniref:hypothetical protein n=1 Tax=Sulfitobacter sp. DSM 110093 TaxID=2883127 RepID=UPI001FAD252A|nr:hypothetical protein [Sulfitobacter sp. DSM 110093]